MSEKLITTALQRGFLSQPTTPGLVVHSDRGGQNCGNAYRQLLHDHQALRSQNRCSDCYDNALPGVRPRPSACGHASKRRCPNFASGPCLPT